MARSDQPTARRLIRLLLKLAVVAVVIGLARELAFRLTERPQR